MHRWLRPQLQQLHQWLPCPPPPGQPPGLPSARLPLLCCRWLASRQQGQQGACGGQRCALQARVVHSLQSCPSFLLLLAAGGRVVLQHIPYTA
jgi:hypothetical protein